MPKGGQWWWNLGRAVSGNRKVVKTRKDNSHTALLGAAALLTFELDYKSKTRTAVWRFCF